MNIAESFERSRFGQFVTSPAGRVTRVVAGITLIGWGYVNSGGTTGLILMVAGLAPLATGTLNVCVVSALLGGSVSGARG